MYAAIAVAFLLVVIGAVELAGIAGGMMALLAICAILLLLISMQISRRGEDLAEIARLLKGTEKPRADD